MACPLLKEVVMLFCDACPMKKMLPLDRIATAEPCLGDFAACPFYRERAASGGPTTAFGPHADVVLQKEVSRQ